MPGFAKVVTCDVCCRSSREANAKRSRATFPYIERSISMATGNWILIYLLLVLCHLTIGTIELSREDLRHSKFEKKILRSARSIKFTCGTDFIFHHLGIADEMNRTNLAILMRQINIGNAMNNRNSNCNKVLSWYYYPSSF